MIYNVKPIKNISQSTSEVGELKNFMGNMPKHFPETKFNLCYNDKSLFLRFDVKDNFVIADAENHFDKVWQDSCVEIFFTPSERIEEGYFNLEINCCGKVYFQFQKSKRNEVRKIELDDIDKLNIKSSFQGTINEEIEIPTDWFIECIIPFEVLEKYSSIDRPSKGTRWRANFNKCADASSYPHWITWNKIELPEPNFHIPKYFGILTFE